MSPAASKPGPTTMRRASVGMWGCGVRVDKYTVGKNIRRKEEVIMAGAGNFTTLRIIVFRGNGPIGIPLVHKLQHMPKDVNSFFHFH